MPKQMPGAQVLFLGGFRPLARFASAFRSLFASLQLAGHPKGVAGCTTARAMPGIGGQFQKVEHDHSASQPLLGPAHGLATLRGVVFRKGRCGVHPSRRPQGTRRVRLKEKGVHKAQARVGKGRLG